MRDIVRIDEIPLKQKEVMQENPGLSDEAVAKLVQGEIYLQTKRTAALDELCILAV